MPQIYNKHLRRLFYRLDLLCMCYDSYPSEEFTCILRKNLGYLDAVLDAVWDESFKAKEGGCLNADWRSETLDKWLAIEWKVGHHDPEAIGAFLKDHDPSELTCNPLELGEFLYLYF
jgi:hypothetical protein